MQTKPFRLWRTAKLLAPALLLTILAASVQADRVIYQTGFESPTFSTGTINGQDSWQAAGGNSSDFIQTAVVETGSQGLEVNTALTTGGDTGATRSITYDSATAPDKFIHVAIDCLLSSTGTPSCWNVIRPELKIGKRRLRRVSASTARAVAQGLPFHGP